MPLQVGVSHRPHAAWRPKRFRRGGVRAAVAIEEMTERKLLVMNVLGPLCIYAISLRLSHIAPTPVNNVRTVVGSGTAEGCVVVNVN